jgi:hypothetical protein
MRLREEPCHFQVLGVRHASFDGSRQATRRIYKKLAYQLPQCDEAQPVCQRCRKAQRICYGMRVGPGCSVIHIENSYASGLSKRPRGPRSTRISEPPDKVAVLQWPVIDLKTRAVAYYSHHYLLTLDDTLNISKSVDHDILPTLMSRAACPILDLAISCMALAVFSRTQKHPPAAIEASVRYHRLLQNTQMAILSLNDANIDTCLLAIFFMARYEDAIYCPSRLKLEIPLASKLPSSSHHDGALSILKVWKENHSYNQPATDVIRHSRRGLIRSAIMRNNTVPEWMLDGTSFGEHGLELDYDAIATRIASLRHRLANILHGKTASLKPSDKFTSITEDLNIEARDIDNALQNWVDHFPRSWNYQRHALPDPYPWPMRDFYSPTVCIYSSPASAPIWSRYFATRVLINSTRLKILEIIPSTTDDAADEQRLECISHMKNMATDLASTIPFCLERFTVTNSPESLSNGTSITLNTSEDIKPWMCTLLVWPLMIASSVGDVDVKQKIWFRSELARLGRIVGFGVLECAESTQWPVNRMNFDEE